MNKIIIIILIIGLSISLAISQNPNYIRNYGIPAVYSGIMKNDTNRLYFVSIKTSDTAYIDNAEKKYTLEKIRINPKGNADGLFFDFNNKSFFGTIYYGLYPEEEVQYPSPVFFKKSAKILNGKAQINISELTGRYDISNWEQKGMTKIGYRIADNYGNIIYDGKLNVSGTGPFKTDLSIISGPFVNKLTDSSAAISFETNYKCNPFIKVEDAEYKSEFDTDTTCHEITINNLKPSRNYKYEVIYGNNKDAHSFKTAPKIGSRKPFTFAFTSDSRSGNGGGERDIFGVNSYIMKQMATLAAYENAAFFQFTGDMIGGYSSSIDETNLQYQNWKRTVEPYWHYMPFYVGMGNHEALVNVFNDGSEYGISIDKFPFSSSSAELVFANNFVNPISELQSEDGAYYDPNPEEKDFPSYSENVYYYIYDNIAVVVLNSNYWYAPSTYKIPEIGGNAHGYIMDNQLNWFDKTISELNHNPDIDHIFVTIHTPAFPNGGHSHDDMWYSGNNSIRPVVSGIKVDKGIIERRDEFLDIVINKSNKVVALLCGDEHNYSRMKITSKTNIYPDKYKGKKLKISRPFTQITNGTAGAPYYGQEKLPWSSSVEKFTTQYALNLFDIEGKSVKLRVINPITLQEIESIILVP